MLNFKQRFTTDHGYLIWELRYYRLSTNRNINIDNNQKQIIQSECPIQQGPESPVGNMSMMQEKTLQFLEKTKGKNL